MFFSENLCNLDTPHPLVSAIPSCGGGAPLSTLHAHDVSVSSHSLWFAPAVSLPLQNLKRNPTTTTAPLDFCRFIDTACVLRHYPILSLHAISHLNNPLRAHPSFGHPHAHTKAVRFAYSGFANNQAAVVAPNCQNKGNPTIQVTSSPRRETQGGKKNRRVLE